MYIFSNNVFGYFNSLDDDIEVDYSGPNLIYMYLEGTYVLPSVFIQVQNHVGLKITSGFKTDKNKALDKCSKQTYQDTLFLD